MCVDHDDGALRHSYPDLNPNPVFEASLEGEVVYTNSAARAVFGDTKDYPWLRDTVAAYANGKRDTITLTIKIDASRWFLFTVFFVEELRLIRFYGMDITKRKHAEEEIQREKDSLESQVRDRTRELEKSIRLYRMLSQCNQALVGTLKEEELTQKICEIIVEDGGYRMAWVGSAERDEEKTVRSVASSGFEEGYFEKAKIVWANVEHGRGPTGTAIRENRIVIGEDFLTDPQLSPWREFALQRGYRSSIAIPLKEENRPPFGALTIYSPVASAFDQSEVGLLKELSGDLSFGILALRVQAEKNEAQRALEQNNTQLHRLSAELTLAEQKERRQLAGVLHDELQQILVGVKLRLECVEGETAKPCQDLLENCLQITRSLTAELSPPVLYKGNMIAVLEWLAKWSKEKYNLNIELETDTHELGLSEDLTVTIYRSIKELIFNIAKHAKTRDGKIEVSSARDRIQIRVSDNGSGFDPSTVQRDPLEGGFGLFAIQERLMNRGCGFSIQSHPGKGSVFTIVVTPKEEAEEVAASATVSARSKIRVLLVDDHSVMRQALAAMLNLSDDIEVVGEAENGRIALDCARRLSPDIVLMDIEMPELDGIKATRLLRLEHPDIRVIGLSMHDKDDVEGDVLSAGASVFLSKNSPSAELIRAIRGVYALKRV